MTTLRLILGDQLSYDIPTLRNANAKSDAILMCEVIEEATYVKHHKQKIAFIFTSMRRFANELRQKGFNPHYVRIDDPKNTGSFENEVKRFIDMHKVDEIIITEAGEYRLQETFNSWSGKFSIPVRILGDDRFLCSRSEFNAWARGKKQLRMEFFYREMRKKYKILLEHDGSPTGGDWNYDKENRKSPDINNKPPTPLIIHPDEELKSVIKTVENLFPNHFGETKNFRWATSREEALRHFNHFIENCLISFGDYQDAMIMNEPFMYHSLISAYVNIGFLNPLEVCKKAEQAYRDGLAPLNAVEGFIRQILGWREYVRGIYWHYMPDFAGMNYLDANLNLPEFYWTGKTSMTCLSEAIRHTKEYAYSHHIQRLMITGNFALIAGCNPQQVCDWYLSVYADAYEWVELPNTLGMALFADNGLMASKPYAASGKYIHRMSNYCDTCQYDPEETFGDKACPFNSLYWEFVARNEAKLSTNQRMTYVYATWRKMKEEKKQSIRAHAQKLLKRFQDNKL